MKKISLVLAALLALTFSAQAQIVSSLPFTLQNGQTADATQVMADFNAIVDDVNDNAATNGVNNDTTRINQFIAIANTNAVGLIAKGRINGIARGYTYQGGSFISDRATETALSPAALLALAATGSEITYTLVPAGSQTRLGVDRDLDTFRDRDELDAGSDPSNAASVPQPCVADVSPSTPDGLVNGADLAVILAGWGGSGISDLDGNGTTDASDLAIVLSAWGACH
jgi:hypothetical protein